MWAELKKLLKDCLTENGNKTYCMFRVAGAFHAVTGVSTFVGGAVYTIVHSHAFDMQSFGIAFGAMMSGCALLAGGVAMKARTEVQ
jgi:hypothetical protein